MSTLSFTQGCFALYHIMHRALQKGFWGLNLRITGSTSVVVSLLATRLHRSKLYGDQLARHDQKGEKRECAG